MSSSMPPLSKPTRSLSHNTQLSLHESSLTSTNHDMNNNNNNGLGRPSSVSSSNSSVSEPYQPNLHIRTTSDINDINNYNNHSIRSNISTPRTINTSGTTQTPKTQSSDPTTSTHLSPHPTTAPVDLPSPTSPTSRRGNALLTKLRHQMRESAAAIEHSTVAVLHHADTHLRGIEPVKSTVEDAMLETLDYDMNEQTNHATTNNNYESMYDSGNHAFSTKIHHDNAPPNSIILFLLQLILTMLIAFITAIAMYLVSSIITYCVQWRVTLVMNLLEDDQNAAGAYFAKIGISIAYCLISACMVAIVASDARGSGVRTTHCLPQICCN